MHISYPVGDFLIRLKNAAIAGRRRLSVPETKLVASVAKKLQELGYIKSVKQEDGNLLVHIAYIADRPVLMDLKLVSKPGLRVYKGVDEIESYKKPSVLILSTPQGILSQKEAIKNRSGGEVIAEVL